MLTGHQSRPPSCFQRRRSPSTSHSSLSCPANAHVQHVARARGRRATHLGERAMFRLENLLDLKLRFRCARSVPVILFLVVVIFRRGAAIAGGGRALGGHGRGRLLGRRRVVALALGVGDVVSGSFGHECLTGRDGGCGGRVAEASVRARGTVRIWQTRRGRLICCRRTLSCVCALVLKSPCIGTALQQGYSFHRLETANVHYSVWRGRREQQG